MSPLSGSPTSREETARDSVIISLCTAVSRATGVVRVLMVGAVLGPSFFGNAFQVINSVPNLIFFGFLAGSLFTSLMVPALVHHIDGHDPGRAGRLSGGYLGVAWVVLAALVPLAVLLVPPLLGALWPPQMTPMNSIHARELLVLAALTLPQAFLYAVVGSAAAVMNAHRRFALANAAPAVENLGVIAVLGAVGLIYGQPVAGPTPTGELLLLGGGSTAAVALHAGLQWWGAYRSGVVLVPRRGWSDPEVVRMIRRSTWSVAQAGLLALQMLAVLVLAGRVAGGSVAVQVAFNFYYLPIALVATPVALAALPRLSRFHQQRAEADYAAELTGALRLALFLALPAALGFMVLAEPLAEVVAAGAMSSIAGVDMIRTSIIALAPGIVGQTIFFVALQAAYARGDTRTSLRSMTCQAVVCLVLCATALLAPQERLTQLLAAAYAAGALIGGADLLRRISRAEQIALRPVRISAGRSLIGSLVMALAVWVVVSALAPAHSGEEARWVLTLLIGSIVGLTAYACSQVLLRSPEWTQLRLAIRARRAPLAGRNESER